VSLEKGDVVVLDYTLSLADTGEVIETTSAEVAKEAGIYKENERYEPAIVVIGEGSLLPGLEEAIKEMKEGEEKEFEIPPEKAFGVRDPSKVKLFSIREFRKAGIKHVYPGMVVEMGNMIGVVKSVDGGRVRVDFNHPYAGKTIKARVKLLKVVKDPKEKAVMLVKRRLPESEVEVENDVVIVKLPLKYILSKNIQAVKVVTADEVFRWVPEIEAVKYVEPIERPKEKGGESEGQGEAQAQGEGQQEQ